VLAFHGASLILTSKRASLQEEEHYLQHLVSIEMGFVAICSAIYDYQPQGENELEIHEGELLYILEKATGDDWWKAKKRAAGEDEDEPEGLIPNNYVEDAKPIHTAKALYDYSRQSDEEVSFVEDASLDIYDTSDPDWTLIGINGEYGFAPSNYIEISGTAPKSPSVASSRRATTNIEPAGSTVASSPTQSVQSPAANLAKVLGGGAQLPSTTAARAVSSPRGLQQQLTPDASDGEAEEPAPALPQRPQSQTTSPTHTQYASAYDDEPAGVLPSPPYNRTATRDVENDVPVQVPTGYHLYNINEMVSAMGKRKKLPVTLGINLKTGTIMLSPEKTRDGPSQEWTADKMTHWSVEGKHVFLELIRPSKSLDLHAGNKDTAEEIISALGEIGGAQRGEGLREIIAAASTRGGQKKGQVLYDFMAQGDDEVTVAVGDEVVILDDTKSEEWWNVKRLKNGKEGMMPSSYIEVTGTIAIEPPSRSGINAGKSAVEQNRLEEERLAKEAVRSHRNRDRADSDGSRQKDLEVGPGMKLPQRGSSLAEDDERRTPKKEKRSSRSEGKSSRSKPDPSKIRTWTDHSGSFKVEAQFIGLSDGKIHLHKQNGVKIAVPVSKMSPEDLEYIEKVTGEPMDEYLPVAMLVDRRRRAASTTSGRAGASIEPPKSTPKAPEYDWFDFFLQAGVGPHQCERYAQSFAKDSMDESLLPDITSDVLRTLGLREGDALKVMKFLDQKLGRTKSQVVNGDENSGSAGGIFSGPGGALHNNTRRGRPETNRQTIDVVDPKALQADDTKRDGTSSGAKPTPLVNAPTQPRIQTGFEDDAWEVKPSTKPASVTQPAEGRPRQTSNPPALTGSMAELSLLTSLQPTVVSPPAPATISPPQVAAQAPPALTQQPQQTGANPSFFAQLGQQQNGLSSQGAQLQSQQLNAPRQRPQPPLQSYTGSALLPPPPRPLSAPQNPQQNQFGLQPLQAQLTGIPRTLLAQAPPLQSLEELNQLRLQQQFLQSQIQTQPTGFLQPNLGLAPYANGVTPQIAGFNPQAQLGGFQQQQAPYVNGNAVGSPFADPRPAFQAPLAPQQTGFGSYQQQGPPPGGINSILPPGLQPQKTAFNPQFQQQQPNGSQQGLQVQPTSFQQPQITSYQPQLQPPLVSYQPQQNFGLQQNGYSNSFSPPPVPPIPQQPPIAPLQPQKTGPAPPVRFGVTEARKLTPQPTGRRANLAQASTLFPPIFHF
jgi:actin cytoskeleton-regulatory complex protein SLA1